MTTNSRIDQAIHWCVRSALRGPKTPLAALATLLDELRHDPSWDHRDIKKVQVVAFRRLVQPGRECRMGARARCACGGSGELPFDLPRPAPEWCCRP